MDNFSKKHTYKDLYKENTTEQYADKTKSYATELKDNKKQNLSGEDNATGIYVKPPSHTKETHITPNSTDNYSQKVNDLKSQLEMSNKKPFENFMETESDKSTYKSIDYSKELLKRNIEAINALGELLQWVPERKRSNLLVNNQKTECTPFTIACSTENEKITIALKNIISLIPKEERHNIMESKSKMLDVIFNLYIRTQDNRNLNEIYELISLAPKEQINACLANIDIAKSIGTALYRENDKSINIITNMLKGTSEKGRENIPWLNKINDSMAYIYTQLGKKKAIPAYRELLALKPEIPK